VAILVLGHSEEDSLLNISESLHSAKAYGMNIEYWNKHEQNALVIDIIQECHNIIFGAADLSRSAGGSPQGDPFLDSCIGILNELSTPVHCVLAPSGVNLETGELEGERLFASSTMALGAPLGSLLQQQDLLGRLYVSDISLPRGFYSDVSEDFPILFDEQPIIPLQIRQAESEDGE
jgi:NAD(P)H-hydrate repair Nnr-like enzyme with NAD(P)H-hydrate epimerase domain